MEIRDRFSGPIEGALAAGGDPATSPLYVFGPFLALIVPAGVAHVTFGPSIWLVVLTVATVAMMYRQVMQWVVDGTGGTGLSEEEFGPTAAKVNASITLVEYSLTFLVSMSALVTFLADRWVGMRMAVAGIDVSVLVAVGLTIATGALVTAGPRTAAVTFGPATAAVIGLLWLMMGAAVWQHGLVLPGWDFAAFDREHLQYTLGGYARILALMTGIEVFANLVAAFDGPPRQRSRFAFRSLVLVMGSTAAAMIVLGPAILALSDPMDPDVSVFTQTMDALLPAPVAWLGTWIGVAVLLSACATAIQGIAHLSHGLSHRHYLPTTFGRPNHHGISTSTVWSAVIVLSAGFVLFGTDERTYLALYAAGVFVLLSMTGWAATKRLVGSDERAGAAERAIQLIAVVAAASLTSVATMIVFAERFAEGAWLYLVLVPILFVAMTGCRASRGTPTSSEETAGRCLACQCRGLASSTCACTIG